jgi:cobalt-zinc-cadmium resistance protein CzcA
MIEVITQPDGWSAEEVERYVTVPLEIGLAGMPGLEDIRSQSLFSLSDVKCYFSWATEYRDARQEVINRLQSVTLPNNLQAWRASVANRVSRASGCPRCAQQRVAQRPQRSRET